ncbi:hypothetical protein V6N13_124467 [Hibiscus sabdariffa]
MIALSLRQASESSLAITYPTLNFVTVRIAFMSTNHLRSTVWLYNVGIRFYFTKVFHILASGRRFGLLMMPGFLTPTFHSVLGRKSWFLIVLKSFSSSAVIRSYMLASSFGRSKIEFIVLASDDKGDVSAETTGPAPAEVSAGTQISAERLAVLLAYP